MLPHGRKDAKLDTKSKLFHLNEIAELYNCNNILFFEARKRQDLYMWLSKAPNGPCVKMHLQNCPSLLFNPPPFAQILTTEYSTHNGRTPLYRECTEGLEADPKL